MPFFHGDVQPSKIVFDSVDSQTVEVTFGSILDEDPKLQLFCKENNDTKSFALDILTPKKIYSFKVSYELVPYPCAFDIKITIKENSFTKKEALTIKYTDVPEAINKSQTILNESTLESIDINFSGPVLPPERLKFELVENEKKTEIDASYSTLDSFLVEIPETVKFLSTNSYSIRITDSFNQDYQFDFKINVVNEKIALKSPFYQANTTSGISVEVLQVISVENVLVTKNNKGLKKVSCSNGTCGLQIKDSYAELLFSYKDAGTTKNLTTPVYVTNKLDYLFDTTFKSCQYLPSSGKFSFTMTLKQNKILDLEKFSARIGSEEMTKTYDKTKLEFVSAQSGLTGTQTLLIQYELSNDSFYNFTYSISLTGVSELTKTLYITEGKGRISFKTSCDLTSIPVYLGEKSLNCRYNSGLNTCEYSVGSDSDFGQKQLKIGDSIISEGIVSIYLSLSEADFQVESGELHKGDNVISISSVNYNLSNIDKIYMNQQVITSFDTQTETKINFILNFATGTEKYSLTALEDSKNSQRKTFTEQLSFEIQQTSFVLQEKYIFLGKEEVLQDKKIHIKFTSNNDASTYEKSIYNKGKKIEGCSSSGLVVTCGTEGFQKESNIEISLREDGLFSQSIQIITHTFSTVCLPSTSQEGISVTLESADDISKISVELSNGNEVITTGTGSSKAITIPIQSLSREESFLIFDNVRIPQGLKLQADKVASESQGEIALQKGLSADQIFTVKFTSELQENEIKEIQIKKQEDQTTSIAKTKKCYINQKDKSSLICSIQLEGSEEEGNSLIGTYIDGCKKEEKAIENLKFIISSSEVNLSVSPLIVESGKTELSVVLGTIEGIEEIQLVRKNTSQEEKVVFAQNPENEQIIKTVTGKGEYYISVILNKKEISFTNVNIIIFEQNIEFKELSKTVFSDATSVTFEMANIEEYLIEEVTLKSSSGLSYPSYSVNENGLTLTDLVYDSFGEYSLFVKDKINQASKTLTLVVVQKPSFISFIDEVVYVEQKELPFTSLKTDSVNLGDLSGGIKAKLGGKDEIEIDSELRLTGKNLEFDTEEPKAQRVILVDANDNEIIQTQNTVTLFSSDKVPSGITVKEIKPKEKKITIISTSVPFYSKLKEKVTVTINKNSCKISDFNSSTQSINANCKNEIEDKAEVTVTIFEKKKLKATVSHKTCIGEDVNKVPVYDETGSLKCILCKELDSQKYLYDQGECVSQCPEWKYEVDSSYCDDKCEKKVEKNKCVEACSEGYVEVDSTCVRCSDDGLKVIDNQCRGDCPKGMLLNEKNECTLITEELSDYNRNNCNDYCDVDGTQACEKNSIFPKCICKEGYMGIICSTLKENADTEASNLLNEIFNLDSEIDLTSNELISKIQELTILVKENNITINNIDNDTSFSETIKTFTLNTLQKEDSKARKSITSLVGLALAVEVRKIKKLLKSTKDTRILQDSSNEAKGNIKEIVEKVIEYRKKNLNEIYNEEDKKNAFFTYDPSNYIYYQIFTNKKESLNSIYSKVKSSNATIVDVSNLKLEKEDLIYTVTELSNEIASLIYNTPQSGRLYLGIYEPVNGGYNEIPSNELQGQSFTALFGFDSNTNQHLYAYYKSKNIDIYNQNDPAFKNPCYYNRKLDYDLTQKYRRKILYQGYKFVDQGVTDPGSSMGEDKCQYVGYNAEAEKLEFTCPFKENGVIGYKLISDPFKISNPDHVDNLPTKCTKEIDNIQDNIAFWLFLVIFLLLIIIGIFTTVNYYKYRYNCISNDLDENDDFTRLGKTEETIKLEDIQINPRSFSYIFRENFFSYHPIFTLCNLSFITPVPWSFSIFIFNIFNLFGFNALYFNETMIEDRIYDKFRNNFAYPMKTEFEKIMASIATSLCLTLIIRAICLVTLNDKNEFRDSLGRAKDYHDTDRITSEFNMKLLPRRLIAGIIMLGLSLFFYDYCVVFCGIYTNTQYGWFYSGIWSLMWVWFVFAPIYILIISIVEKRGYRKYLYYMKRLTIF